MMLNPVFDDSLFEPTTFINHVEGLIKQGEPIPHTEILARLIEQFEPLDFEVLAFPQMEQLRKKLESAKPGSDEAKEIIKQLDKLKLNQKHYIVLSIENALTVAERNRWGLCKNLDFIYLYNGAYWSIIDKDVFQKFLGEAAEKMGVAKFPPVFTNFGNSYLNSFWQRLTCQPRNHPKRLYWLTCKTEPLR